MNAARVGVSVNEIEVFLALNGVRFSLHSNPRCSTVASNDFTLLRLSEARTLYASYFDSNPLLLEALLKKQKLFNYSDLLLVRVSRLYNISSYEFPAGAHHARVNYSYGQFRLPPRLVPLDGVNKKTPVFFPVLDVEPGSSFDYLILQTRTRNPKTDFSAFLSSTISKFRKSEHTLKDLPVVKA